MMNYVEKAKDVLQEATPTWLHFSRKDEYKVVITVDIQAWVKSTKTKVDDVLFEKFKAAVAKVSALMPVLKALYAGVIASQPKPVSTPEQHQQPQQHQQPEQHPQS